MDFSGILDVIRFLGFPGNASVSIANSQGAATSSSPSLKIAANYPTGGVSMNSPSGSVGVKLNQSSAGIS
jgi:hypothetical protein